MPVAHLKMGSVPHSSPSSLPPNRPAGSPADLSRPHNIRIRRAGRTTIDLPTVHGHTATTIPETGFGMREATTDASSDDHTPQPDYRPLTKIENRGIKLGHGVWDVVFQRV